MGNHVYEAPNGVILSWQIHPAGYQVIFTSSSDEKSTDYFEPESYSNGEVYIERKDCIIIKKRVDNGKDCYSYSGEKLYTLEELVIKFFRMHLMSMKMARFWSSIAFLESCNPSRSIGHRLVTSWLL